MKIYVAADHRGFKLKHAIVKYLVETHRDVVDLGPTSLKEEDDYPDYVIPLMKKLEADSSAQGIVICRNGVGVCVLANKSQSIRAALSWDPEHAKTSKTDDNANVLALPADFVDENTAKDIVNAWLKTEFSHEERHLRRLKKVQDYK